MQRVVLIVVPLRPERPFQKRCFVRFILEDQMHRAIGACAHRGCEFVQEEAFGAIVDGMHRVQTQAVEAIFVRPVQRVLDEECSHVEAFRRDVDGRAPRRLISIRI